MEIKKGTAISIICAFMFVLAFILEKNPDGLLIKDSETSTSPITESTTESTTEETTEETKGTWSKRLIELINNSIVKHQEFINKFNSDKEDGLLPVEGGLLAVELAELQIAINELQAENNLTTTHSGIFEELNNYCANMTAFITLAFTVCTDDTGDRTHNQVIENAEVYAKAANENLQKVTQYSNE